MMQLIAKLRKNIKSSYFYYFTSCDIFKLSKNELGFISPCGLGDTFLLCAFSKALEEKYQGQIRFFIKPSHEVVMKMFSISNYTIINFNNIKSYYLDYLAKRVSYPKKHQTYIAHINFHQNRQEILLQSTGKTSSKFFDFYKNFLYLPDIKRIDLSRFCSPLPSLFLKKIEDDLSKLHNVILLAPEANSIKNLDPIFWERLAIELNKAGFFLISNVTNSENKIKGTNFIAMTTQECVDLATHCRAVISLRSGLCDLLFFKGKDLFIIYCDDNLKSFYSLNNLFVRSDINEYVFEGCQKTINDILKALPVLK